MREGKGSARSWWPLGVLLAVVVVSLGLACNGNGGKERTVVITFATPTQTSVPVPTATPVPSPTPTPTPSPDVCGHNPDPASPSVLQIEDPKPGERVGNPFHVRGWGSQIGLEDFGVVVAVVNADRQVIQDWVVPPQQTRTYRILPPGLENTEYTRPFAIDISLTDLAGPTSFCLWVFLKTDEAGNPKGIAQVSVLVAP